MAKFVLLSLFLQPAEAKMLYGDLTRLLRNVGSASLAVAVDDFNIQFPIS